MTRIEPLSPPYSPETAAQLEHMMPPGVPPILLFRTFAKNLPMTDALRGWGGYELNADLSLTMRDREILIDRTTALCKCEYEWGVHIVFFAERVKLSPAQITSLTHGKATDACWTESRDRLLIEAADQLHTSAQISDDLWELLSEVFSEAQCLDIFMMCGWYHAISFAANGARIPLEEGTPTFASVQSS